MSTAAPTKRQKTDDGAEAAGPDDIRVTACHDVKQWHKDNIDLFAPPICNKLMHKDQITVMFVGGPNSREDFHLDLGSEFFYQMEGTLSLPTIQQGKRVVVTVNAGEVFLLPSRVPHSPQRSAGGFGLVIERERRPDELDGMEIEQPLASSLMPRCHFGWASIGFEAEFPCLRG